MHRYHGFSSLSLCSSEVFWYWEIYYGINSTFTPSLFGTKIRSATPCLIGTSIDCIVDNYCLRVYKCSKLCWLIHMDLHTLWILIGIQNLSDNFSAYSYPKTTNKKLIMCTWYYNWQSWTIQRLCLVSKRIWGYGLAKSIHNDSTCVTTIPIHWVGKWCL